MDKTSQVDCFFFYMWNVWSKEECDTAFGNRSAEIWSKWEHNLELFGNTGAPAWLYADIKRADRHTLVDRAVKHYNE